MDKNLMQKKYKAICLITTIFFLVISSINPVAAFEKSDARLWKEDIDYFKSQLEKKHINLYHSTDAQTFNKKIEVLVKKLSTLNKYEIMVEMMRITRTIGDGHTRFSAMAGPHHHYPISLEWVDGKIRAMAVKTEHKALLGNELIAIDGVPLSEIIDNIEPIMQSVENKHSLHAAYQWHINIAELLYGLHITPSLEQATFTFVDEKKVQKDINLEAVSMSEFVSSVVHRLHPDRGVFSDPEIKNSDGLWLSSNKALNTSYLYFAQYPSAVEMETFSKNVKNYLRKNNTQNFIIDLRDNRGGDFFVGSRLAEELVQVDSLNWNNGMYVLIGEKTFSAGMSNAAQFRDLLNATLVGEPTGGNPVGYQDVDGFRLPNSKRYVSYSKRMYRFQSEITQGVIPDHQVKNDWDSYTSGKDKQLAFILSLIEKNK